MTYFAFALFFVCLVTIVHQGEAQGCGASCITASLPSCTTATTFLACVRAACTDSSSAALSAISAAETGVAQQCGSCSVIASLMVTFFAAVFAITSKM